MAWQASGAAEEAALHIVTQHNRCWGKGDVAGVLALYHPEMRFYEHATGQCFQGAALHAHVQGIIGRSVLETLQYLDRPRVDGDTVFLRYQETMHAPDGGELLRFSACDAVTVQAGLIVEINEYATLQPATRTGQRPPPAAQKIGLGPRALGCLLADLGAYFDAQRPYLQAGLTLQAVADACGYTRNQISYALNHGMGLTFYQYLNRARIRHVLAGDPRIGIPQRAREAGFRSLSTFYAAYRAETGATPGGRKPPAR